MPGVTSYLNIQRRNFSFPWQGAAWAGEAAQLSKSTCCSEVASVQFPAPTPNPVDPAPASGLCRRPRACGTQKCMQANTCNAYTLINSLFLKENVSLNRNYPDAAGLVLCSAQFLQSSPLVNTDAVHVCQWGRATVMGSPLIPIAHGPSLPICTTLRTNELPATNSCFFPWKGHGVKG